MTKAEYTQLVEQLKSNDYGKYKDNFSLADYYWAKSFHKEDNPFTENDRSCYLLTIYVYDYSIKDYPQLTPEQRNHVGLEVQILFSRTTDERIDLTLTWNEKSTIESIEQEAESFYQWAITQWPIPRQF